MGNNVLNWTSPSFGFALGVIKDPYKEFLIAEHDSVQKERVTEDFNDQYWETHYTIEQERIPSFLERFAKNILRAGKDVILWYLGGLIVVRYEIPLENITKGQFVVRWSHHRFTYLSSCGMMGKSGGFIKNLEWRLK